MKCDWCGDDIGSSYLKQHRRYRCPQSPYNKYMIRLTPDEVKALSTALKPLRKKALRKLKEDIKLLLKIVRVEGRKTGSSARQILGAMLQEEYPRIDRRTWYLEKLSPRSVKQSGKNKHMQTLEAFQQ